jgi:hypothetical protein
MHATSGAGWTGGPTSQKADGQQDSGRRQEQEHSLVEHDALLDRAYTAIET